MAAQNTLFKGTKCLSQCETLLFLGSVRSSAFGHMMRNLFCALQCILQHVHGEVSISYTPTSIKAMRVHFSSLNIYPPLLTHFPAVCKWFKKMVSGFSGMVIHVQGFVVKEGKADLLCIMKKSENMLASMYHRHFTSYSEEN